MKKYEIAEKIRALIGDVLGLYKLTGDETAALLAAIESGWPSEDRSDFARARMRWRASDATFRRL